MNSDIAISVNSPIVVSETRDGESIIMHHGTGTFFDSSGSGAYIWQLIDGGTSLAAIADALTTQYEIDGEAALTAARQFVDQLVVNDLVTLGGDAIVSPAAVPAMGERGPMPEPVLGVHTDLADMLLLDPIHDVDQAGWPVAAS